MARAKAGRPKGSIQMERNDPNYYTNDTGCKYAPACRECPFPGCLEEVPARVRAAIAVKCGAKNV